MKLVSQIKLTPTDVQFSLLRSTLEQANAVCNRISLVAWQNKTFGRYDLHHILYHQLRCENSLSSQMIIRSIAKVSDSYLKDHQTLRVFNPDGAIAFDDRILSFSLDKQCVSIWTLQRRQHIGFVAGEEQLRLLSSRRGESDLVFRDGSFYLLVTCEVEEPPVLPVMDVMGIDLGIANIATTSDGTHYSGEEIEATRKKYNEHRAGLQKAGTRSAKRHLRYIARKQKRFQRHTNHCISKRIIDDAKGTGRGIALENLKGIRGRVTVQKQHRNKHSNWSFGQLRSFLSYKAKRAGIPVIIVNPQNTSRECNQCGWISSSNRKSRSRFECCNCGHSADADENAALVIRARGVVNHPMVSTGFAR